MDEWYGLTMDDIRRIEDETKQELDKVSVPLSFPLSPSLSLCPSLSLYLSLSPSHSLSFSLSLDSSTSVWYHGMHAYILILTHVHVALAVNVYFYELQLESHGTQVVFLERF